MSVPAISGMRPPISIGAEPGVRPSDTGAAAFKGIVEDLLSNEANAATKANHAIQLMATGKSGSMHEVTLAVAQADLQFRLILELRNRLTEAYQEVMRMPM